MEDLAVSIVQEIASLTNIYYEFKRSFENLNDFYFFKEKLLEKLEEKKRPLTRSRVKIHEIVAENEKEDETLNIEFENNETMREEDETSKNESAREQILALIIRGDDSSSEEEEEETNKIINLKEKYKLKDLEIKLYRVDDLEKQHLKQNQDVDNLCDIDGFLNRISKPDNNKGDKTRNEIKKSEISDSNDIPADDCLSFDEFEEEEEEEEENENMPLAENADYLAKNKITNLIDNDESDDETESDDDEIEETSSSQLSSSKKSLSKTTNQSSPILSPLRLNLIKSPSRDESSLSSEDSVVRKRSKRILDSDDSISDSDNMNKKRKSKLMVESEDDVDDDDSSVQCINSSNEDESNDGIYRNAIKNSIKSSNKKKHENSTSRRELRDIIENSKLKPETSNAIMEENERLKRLNNLKNQNIETEENDDLIILNSTKNKEPQRKYLYLDNAQKMLSIDSKISCHLKDHQIKGIQFMFESCYESLEEIKRGNAGTGCVLAHCMGLGKSLQVISLVSTLLANSEETKTKRVIILSPKNVILNWRAEFQNWLKGCEMINTFEITNIKTLKDRLNMFEEWFTKSGVLILGYTMFANFTNGKCTQEQGFRDDIEKYLINPGCDLLICDEGHVLKNSKSVIAQCVSRVKTRRRIMLTGSPLQNNLEEYHCMVSLVKPNLLGSIKEFRNRFVNPINNGHFSDSTEADVKLMKKRAHILHKTLIGCVQRMDATVIKPYIPPKQEYVIYIRLSELQQNLYKKYLEHTVTTKNVEREAIVGSHSKNKGIQLLVDWHELSRILSHPWALKKKFEEHKKISDSKKESAAVNTNDEDEYSSFCEEIDSDHNEEEEKPKKPKEIDLEIKKELFADINTAGGGVVENIGNKKQSSDEFDKWWINLIDDDEIENRVEFSGKMVLLFEVLRFCDLAGEKLIVFSQSILTLNLIEKFIKNSKMAKFEYFRIDGETQSENRKKYINMFNDANNRVKLFLISTKAGGIGVNLVGASRCVIFDSSWNPVHDLQSIFRIYRLGQKKKVFIYRFLAQGTMEEKIYNRQVTKQSLSLRVIDEHQLDRHFKKEELRELYKFNTDVYDSTRPKLLDIKAPPPDPLLLKLLNSCDKWISNYIEHDSLLENRLDEGLSEQERENAWLEFTKEQEHERLRAQFQLEASNQNLQITSQNGLSSPMTIQDLSRQFQNYQKFPSRVMPLKLQPNDISIIEQILEPKTVQNHQINTNVEVPRITHETLRLQYLQKQNQMKTQNSQLRNNTSS